MAPLFPCPETPRTHCRSRHLTVCGWAKSLEHGAFLNMIVPHNAPSTRITKSLTWPPKRIRSRAHFLRWTWWVTIHDPGFFCQPTGQHAPVRFAFSSVFPVGTKRQGIELAHSQCWHQWNVGLGPQAASRYASDSLGPWDLQEKIDCQAYPPQKPDYML